MGIVMEVIIRLFFVMKVFTCILAAFLCLPICAMGQDSESLLPNDKVIETPPMYNKKHFALGMYEALYNATSQSMSSDFDEFYVELLFYVDANGKVDSVNLHKSTGYDYIDNKMLQLSKRLVKRHKLVSPAVSKNGESISSTVLLPMYFHMCLPPGEKTNGKSIEVQNRELYEPSSQWYWTIKNGTDENQKGLYWPGKYRGN